MSERQRDGESKGKEQRGGARVHVMERDSETDSQMSTGDPYVCSFESSNKGEKSH